MCIRDSSRDWHAADMTVERFEQIAPYLKNVDTVVLEGWGEALLYPNLTDAIRLVKRFGARAGFVTSGWGLDKSYAAALLNAGVDFIGFSLAGATPGTHDAIRIKSDLQKVCAAIQDLVAIKAERKQPTPQLHIVFLMLRDNLAEIPRILELAHTLGVAQVVLIHLIQVTTPWQEEQRVFHCDAETDELLKEAERKATSLGIGLRAASLSPREIAVCDENPLRNLYISVGGEVSPCVYLYPPVPAPIRKLFCGRTCNVNKVSFGNIFTQPFEVIWNSRRYQEFRDCFAARRKRFEDLYLSPLWDPGRLRNITRESYVLPDAPEPCRTCHKMLGF
jgi:MoaA/NifB/PqqE/SkfB family radical SAM enzyme